jgi:ABC-type multidrug transport system fused ATPase/permease subunit
VLVFDEGTSALDNVTEAQLVEMLEQVRGERTIMVVAHRLSSVRACDYIVFVDEGRVIAVAPFGELIETNPAFRDMAART